MDWIVAVLMIFGSAFALVGALGVCRFPDFYSRTHAAAKAGAFGAAIMLLSCALYFGTPRTAITAIATIVFFYLTAPVAAQTVAQAAYRRGVPFWSKFGEDQLARDEDALEAETKKEDS